jgi:hypothetical protein
MKIFTGNLESYQLNLRAFKVSPMDDIHFLDCEFSILEDHCNQFRPMTLLLCKNMEKNLGKNLDNFPEIEKFATCNPPNGRVYFKSMNGI